MSVLGLVLLSMTPIAALGVLLGIGRFESYLLEGGEAPPYAAPDPTSGLPADDSPSPIAPAVTAQELAPASRTAA